MTFVWDKDYQTMWDDLKTKSNAELVGIIETYINDLTADMEPYMVIELIKKYMNLPFNPPSSQTPKEEWLKDGWPEKKLCEVKI